MLRVERQPYGNELTISLDPESTKVLHSLVEFISRYEDLEDRMTDDELNLATTLAGELNAYIMNDISLQLESDAIDYINESYK